MKSLKILSTSPVSLLGSMYKLLSTDFYGHLFDFSMWTDSPSFFPVL